MRNLVVHVHEFLLTVGCNIWIHDREKLDGGEFGCEAFPVHQALNHAHDAGFKVSDSDRRQNFLDTFSGLRKQMLKDIKR